MSIGQERGKELLQRRKEKLDAIGVDPSHELQFLPLMVHRRD